MNGDSTLNMGDNGPTVLTQSDPSARQATSAQDRKIVSNCRPKKRTLGNTSSVPTLRQITDYLRVGQMGNVG
jgi:hypothetical protein